MISLKINAVPTIFIKAFKADDVNTILEFVRNAYANHRGASNRVLFIDTPITAATVETVEKLEMEGIEVSFRDHHGIDGQPRNDREKQVVMATAKLRSLLGERCVVNIRRIHPACSTLVAVGEFADAVAIVADPDADGLTAAMKAAGIYYEGLDEDAAKLDGEPQLQVTGTAISQLLAKGIATIPSYDACRPREREVCQQRLFSDWMKAVQGDERARARLEAGVKDYDEAVKVAQELASNAIQVAPGVLLVDAVNSVLFDPGTLNSLLEQNPGCRITVVKKSLGPIAALHGVQYSLAVTKSFQNKVDLFKLVPEQAKSDPEAGIISNVSFLLHTSDDVWQKYVLPRLLKEQDQV